MKRKLVFLCAVAVCMIPVLLAAQAIDIRNSPIAKSPHNMAAWSANTVKAVSENQICKFCHLAHGASWLSPLWGHKLSSATYRLYSSATLQSPRNQPDAGSKLCLSCHDGTVSVGATNKGNIQIAAVANRVDANGLLLAKTGQPVNANLGTDFFAAGANSHFRHPISIAVTNGLVTATQPNTWKLNALRTVSGKLQLDQFGTTSRVFYPLEPTGYADKSGNRNTDKTGIQCATCHDPHNNQYGRFMNEKVSFTSYSCAHGGSGGTSLGGFCYHCHQSQPPNP